MEAGAERCTDASEVAWAEECFSLSGTDRQEGAHQGAACIPSEAGAVQVEDWGPDCTHVWVADSARTDRCQASPAALRRRMSDRT